jgi:hypothetical protein
MPGLFRSRLVIPAKAGIQSSTSCEARKTFCDNHASSLLDPGLRRDDGQISSIP